MGGPGGSTGAARDASERGSGPGVLLDFQGGRIELVEPCEGSRIKSTGADRGRPDHLCFRCDNFDEMIKGARSNGGVVVRPPVPSQAFEGKRMAFVLYHALGLIEWVER